jgi:hypothetical protein
MSVPVIIIIGGPRPGNITSAGTTFAETRHEFDTVAEAIAFLESQNEPGIDQLPSGDGTSES